MLNIIWDYRGIIHQEYMVKGTKINSGNYVKTPEKIDRMTQHVCQ